MRKIVTITILWVTSLVTTSAQDTPSEPEVKVDLPKAMTADPEEGYVVVKANVPTGKKASQIEWLVVATGEKPVKYTDLGDSLIVAVPRDGESVLIYVIAVIDGKLTKHATTTLTTKKNGNTPIDPKKPPTTFTPVPKTITKLHVVLVIDQTRAPKELLALAASDAVRKELQKSQSTFYVYDINSDELKTKKIRPLVETLGKLPALVVMAGTPPHLGKVVPGGKAQLIPLTNDNTTNEHALLDLTGKAAETIK